MRVKGRDARARRDLVDGRIVSAEALSERWFFNPVQERGGRRCTIGTALAWRAGRSRIERYRHRLAYLG